MKILVFKEKHGDRYLKASTPEEIQESCLKVLRERFEDENDMWGYAPDGNLGDPPMLDDIIDSLPEPYKQLEKDKKKVYQRRYDEYRKDLHWYGRVKAELENPAGDAYKLLRWRADYQHEGFWIEGVK